MIQVREMAIVVSTGTIAMKMFKPLTGILLILVMNQASFSRASDYAVSRTPEGQPDLQGIWQTWEGAAAWDIEAHEGRFTIPAGGGIVIDPPDRKIPYQQWALEKRRDLIANHMFDDPQAHCILSGFPRHNYAPYGFQLLQPDGGKYIVFLYENFHAYRVVPLDGRPHIPDSIRLYNGDSRGHWQGATLVIDVTNQNGKTWLDMAGNFTSPNLHVTERFTRTGENTIRYEATLEDSTVYTRSWTVGFNLDRIQDENYQILEFACHEGERDLQHYPEDTGRHAGDGS